MFSYIWGGKIAVIIPDYNSGYKVTHVLPLLWIEHCVECAAPLCYSSCKIYKPRSDGRCLRFEDGVVPYDFGNGIVGGQIEFRRWAKIQAKLSENLIGIPVIRNNRIQNRINKVGLFLEKLFENVAWHKHRPSKVVESIGLIYTQKHIFKGDVKAIDGFMATVYNHQDKEQKFIFEIEDKDRIYYKNQILLEPGWNEKFIPILDMRIDCLKSPHVRLYLDNNDTGKFTFMFLDFVSYKNSKEKKPASKVKCVAWDLDNTLWEGVIGDNANIKPREDVLQMIGQLDKRGILQTIVSKNNHDIAWQKIEEIGMSDYFLYPAINWGRKSQNLMEIAKELNINVDSFALIDDSEFERKEVKTALPQVRVYDAKSIDSLLYLPEFDVSVTELSSHRRQS
jgi:HAD superfamily phosphatase (TIGR01681 family)